MINDELACCGVREYSGFESKNVDEILMEITHNLFCPKSCDMHESDRGFGYSTVLFSFRTRFPLNNKKYKQFCSLIKKLKLGGITSATVRKNPNTGAKLRTFLWGINQRNAKKFYQSNLKKINKQYCIEPNDTELPF